VVEQGTPDNQRRWDISAARQDREEHVLDAGVIESVVVTRQVVDVFRRRRHERVETVAIHDFHGPLAIDKRLGGLQVLEQRRITVTRELLGTQRQGHRRVVASGCRREHRIGPAEHRGCGPGSRASAQQITAQR